MKFVSVHYSFILYCFFYCFLGLVLSGISVSIAGENTLDDSKQGSGISTTTPASTDEYSPLSGAFNYNNLDNTVKMEVKEDQVNQRNFQKAEQSLRYQDNIPDQLTLEFRKQQEYIRLAEVLILAIMSLGTLGIMLTCMKNSQVCNARDMLNAAGLILVIFSTVMVIIIADAEIQLTAAMGVLGGIAGYLFGTLRSTYSTEKYPSQAEPEQKKSLTKD